MPSTSTAQSLCTRRSTLLRARNGGRSASSFSAPSLIAREALHRHPACRAVHTRIDDTALPFVEVYLERLPTREAMSRQRRCPSLADRALGLSLGAGRIRRVERALNLDKGQLKQRRASRRTYSNAIRDALIALWEASDRVCGIPVLLPTLERHGRLNLSGVDRALVLTVSPATGF